jgi:hypothetical protein
MPLLHKRGGISFLDSNRSSMTYTCMDDECGLVFESRRPSALYCSVECRYRKSKRIVQPCERVGCTGTFKANSNDGRRFCSRSCSNRATPPRRTKTKTCTSCPTLIEAKHRYCSECRPTRDTIDAQYLERKICDFVKNAKYQVNAQLRTLSRATYKASGRPYACQVCGYSTHVEICHIKDIHQCDPNDTIGSICELSNLVALCRNHHWEFDHGHIGIAGIKKKYRRSKQTGGSA